MTPKRLKQIGMVSIGELMGRKPQMAKPSDYKHIRAWGKMLHSFAYYIFDQQEKAAKDNAPLDAVYWKEDEKRWVCFSEVTSQDTIDLINRMFAHPESYGLGKEV